MRTGGAVIAPLISCSAPGKALAESLKGGGGKALACHPPLCGIEDIDKLDLVVYNLHGILKNELAKGTPGNYIAEALETTGSR